VKKSIALAVALILGVCIATAAAVDVTRFGPKQYVREKGKPQTVTDTFAAYADPGTILVENGDGDGDHRVRSAVISLNGQQVFGPSDFNPHVGHLEATVDLLETNTLEVEVRSKPGSYLTITIIQDVEPPTASITADPDSIFLGESATLSWDSTNADLVTIDQGIGAVDPIGSLTVSPEETTTYTITAANDGGQAQASVTITVTNPVPTVEISADPAIILYGESSTLFWTSTYAEQATIDQGIGDVPVEGSITVTPTRTTTYTITVTNPIGTASAHATVMVQADVEPQPEGSFGEQYEDLIPPDATQEEYDPKRFSVITGLIKDQTGVPIEEVNVTILHHPEYGTAYTDGGGRYSIPAEGGSVLIVVCQKEGLITAHRKVDVPWNDIAIAETMVMIPQDTKATTVTFDGDPNTVVTHQSTEISDEWGNRSCTTVFTGDNTAYLVDENGNTLQELTTITTRATEFTTPESMPAKLPPNSMYTYCVDLTVDGAERVKFQKPVVTWVDNFLDFDVGMAVPVGAYDRDQGVWVPENNGVVVKLLDTDNDTIVDALDATGDDLPDDLNNNGSYTDEVQGLNDAQIYHSGATYWRFTSDHFTPKDPNLPAGTPQDATGPNPDGEASTDSDGTNTKDKECKKDSKNSLVRHISRTFHEDISIPGTDFILHYASDRVDGYHHVITVPVSGNTVPASLKQIVVQLRVSGRTLEQILDPLPNQKIEFEWDGLDHLGRPVKGSTIVRVNIGFVYDAVYYIPANLERSFGQAGIGPTSVQTREEITLWKRDNLKLSKGVGTIAEGWTISPHHFLSLTDPSTLHKGDGTIIEAYASIIDTVAGTGAGGAWGGFAGDGGPAIEAELGRPFRIELDANGNLYIADSGNHRIRKVDTNGIITTIAGSGPIGSSGGGYSGDGGPATE
jgi:hypothetical protein